VFLALGRINAVAGRHRALGAKPASEAARRSAGADQRHHSPVACPAPAAKTTALGGWAARQLLEIFRRDHAHPPHGLRLCAVADDEAVPLSAAWLNCSAERYGPWRSSRVSDSWRPTPAEKSQRRERYWPLWMARHLARLQARANLDSATALSSSQPHLGLGGAGAPELSVDQFLEVLRTTKPA